MSASLPLSSRTRSKSTQVANSMLRNATNKKRKLESLEILDRDDGSKLETPSKKQKIMLASTPKAMVEDENAKMEVIEHDNTQMEEIQALLVRNKRLKLVKKDTGQEKRLRPFRKTPPRSFHVKLGRAISQRMFVIHRTRGGSAQVPQEMVDMAGSTGNLYNIHISRIPSCTCPDYRKSHQCKHIIYVLHNVLKAPQHLQYQLAFVSSELREIFSKAPPPLSSHDNLNISHRKEITGDCPICFTEFQPDVEEIVWCKAACGNNIHRDCFEKWAKSQTTKQQVRCVFCRTLWQGDVDSIQQIQKTGNLNAEGYVNVGQQLGISERRDTSSYHQFWVRQQQRLGGFWAEEPVHYEYNDHYGDDRS